MSIEKEAAKYGLSRQTYQLRLKNWVEMEINGSTWLVNKKYMMELKESNNDK